MQPDLSVARVVGFHCETPSPFELLKDLAAPDLSSSPCTTRQKLPESPLGRMLRSDRPTGFPKLTLKSLGKPGSSSAGHLGLNLSRRAFSAAPGEVLTPVTPSCSRLSSSSEPIPIPEYCRSVELKLVCVLGLLQPELGYAPGGLSSTFHQLVLQLQTVPDRVTICCSSFWWLARQQ